MNRYINKSLGLKAIHYKDGSAKFLKRGEVFETSESVDKVDDGVVVEKKTRTRRKKSQIDSVHSDAESSTNDENQIGEDK